LTYSTLGASSSRVHDVRPEIASAVGPTQANTHKHDNNTRELPAMVTKFPKE